MKHIFIVNSVSGKGTALNLIDTIKEVCEERHLDYDVLLTSYEGQAKELASSIKPGDVTVYSVGGDGTLLEIVNNLDPKITLGIIPAGSGNDFYRYFHGVCEDFKTNLINTIDVKPIKVDIGKSNKMLFLNSTSVGIDAQINYDACYMIRNTVFSKNLAYPLSILKTVFLAHSDYYQIKVDDKDYSGKYYVIACMNGQYYGNGIMASPISKIDDGYIDLVLFKDCPKIKGLFKLVKYLKGKHYGDKQFDIISGKNITIDCDSLKACQSDGENYKSKHIEVHVLENYLNLKISN